jgi:hypothetical protein
MTTAVLRCWWYDGPGLSVGVEFVQSVIETVHFDREQAWIGNLERERDLYY